MLLIWGADSGAYFAGRRWGKRKLAVQLSPGKTWEGVCGGAVLALLLVLPLTVWLLSNQVTGQMLWWPAYALLCVVTIVVSVSGDLLESVAKRRAGVKDSGQILPGHGGVLDRIDSLTAAAPCFTLGLLWLGLIPGAGA
jgi:phosphatidate cytidylyltransferase